jgi:hypothetical protein
MLIKTKGSRLLRFVALTGIIGPVLFGALLVILTILEYDFMRSLRWQPLNPIDWPSGLALGPYGAWMTAGFAGAGLALMLFALGLRQLFSKSVAPPLFFISGAAMLLLIFPTDPTYSSLPKTLHSLIHDAGYVLLGISFVPGMIVLARQLRQFPEWKAHAHVTWLAVALIIPTFILKGVALYIFLLTILTWYGLTSLRILQLMNNKDSKPHE